MLSKREREVMDALNESGATVKSVAEKLGMSPHTVAGRLLSVRSKLNVRTYREALAALEELGPDGVRVKEPTPIREPTTIYRYFDADDRLLYVGITNNPHSRQSNHRNDAPWWAQVVRATFEHRATRREAEAAELRAIQTEHPVYNVAGVIVPNLSKIALVAPPPRPSPPTPHEALTGRELQILYALAQPGASQRSVAEDLGIAIGTIKNHLAAVYRKLNVSTCAQALWVLGPSAGVQKPAVNE